jgi:AcrR family transcriptional regulator
VEEHVPKQKGATTEVAEVTEPKSLGGRPRDLQLDAAILDATRFLLRTEGYQGTTIQAVARRAKVGAPSIYRRWATKPALVEDAIFPVGASAFPEPTGDFGADLRRWVNLLLQACAEPAARNAIPGLLMEYLRDPEAWDHMFQVERIPTRDAFARLIEDGIARGAVRPGISPDVTFEALMAVLYRALIHGDKGAKKFIDSFTDLLLRGIAAD